MSVPAQDVLVSVIALVMAVVKVDALDVNTHAMEAVKTGALDAKTHVMALQKSKVNLYN